MEKKKILVIDDTLKLLEELRDLLVMEGYEVVTATDAYVGMSMVAKENPDLIITDLNMPEMHGFDLITKLKSLRISEHIPIIVLSGDEGDEIVRRAFNLKADLFIKKPSSADELLTSVERALSWSK
ncbi:MAG: response regulator [Fulvivirga sp.]